MTDDLVKRLRETRLFYKGDYSTEAADRIEAMTAENERLREALEKIANYSPAVTHGWAVAVRHIARAALEGKQ